MTATSAGILLNRVSGGGPQVLLVHPGGPFWRRRDEGAWSIPKGECGPDEDPLAVARREFAEELGTPPPAADLQPLGSVRQAGGKVVLAWTGRGEFDPAHFVSNTFELEWPPRSGKIQSFPEVDRVGWWDMESARRLLLPAQRAFIDRLQELLLRPT
jgi:predicted NUDIX family NTP pyrophosphohydrolase